MGAGWKVAGVGVTGDATEVGIVGVSPPSADKVPFVAFISSCDFFLVRRAWSTGECRDANSCAPSFGGGRKPEPGEGNGEVDDG